MKIVIDENISLSGFLTSDDRRLVELLSEKTIYDQTLAIPYPYTISHAQNWIEIANALTPGFGSNLTRLTIRDKHNELMGSIGLNSSVLNTHKVGIGYWLGKPYWNNGVMSRVVPAFCKYVFETFSLNKLTASCFVTNEASARVLTKSGFKQEGYLRNHYLKDGKLSDAKLFGLINSGTTNHRIRQNNNVLTRCHYES